MDRSAGGLDNPDTNQRFIDLRTNELLNYRFQNTANNNSPITGIFHKEFYVAIKPCPTE